MKKSRFFLQCSGSAFWPQLCEDLQDNFELSFAVSDDRIATEFSKNVCSDILFANDLKFGLFNRELCVPIPPRLRTSRSFLRRQQEALYSFERSAIGGSVSFPDRLQILSSLADFFWFYFKKYEPSFGLATEAPHTFPTLILHGVAEACEIPILHFQQNSIAPTVRPVLGPNYERVRVNFSSLDESWRMRTLAPQKRIFAEFFENAATDNFTELEVDWQKRESSTFSGPKSWWRRLYIPFAWLSDERDQQASYCERLSLSRERMPTPTHRVSKSQGRSGLLLISAKLALDQARTLRDTRKELLHRSTSSLPDHFATMFLHFEPEKTSVPDGGVFGDQLAAARAVADALAGKMPLAICEHPSQNTLLLRGFRIRRARFYEELAQIPNAFLVDPSVPRSELLARTRLGVTLQGTVGLEMIARSIPVIALGHAWYSPVEGVFCFDDVWPLESLVDRALQWQGGGQEAALEALWNTVASDSIVCILNPSFGTLFPEAETDCKSLRALIVSLFGPKNPDPLTNSLKPLS